MNTYERLQARYQQGDVPWDAPLPPPEVITTLRTLPPGRALDVGCGYGRAAVYMAQHRWQVDGVDFIPDAIAEARRRTAEAGVETAVAFYVDSVIEMSALSGPYDFALDVGCAHSFDAAQLVAYGRELCRLVRSGGHYLLFAHLRNDVPKPDESWRWTTEGAIMHALRDGFKLQRKEPGETHVGDHVWRSAWYWFVRRTSQTDDA